MLLPSSLPLLLVACIPLVVCVEEFCSQDVGCPGLPASANYLAAIQNALDGHRDCPRGACHCYDDVVDRNLNRFAANGIAEIAVQPFKRTVLYQVIDHKLYRNEECSFPTRCSGVEHFLIKMIDDLPNTQFLLNVFDYPLVNQYHNPSSSVFSFSKTDDYFDIMYPAWSFWEGGPSIKPYPAGIGRWDLIREQLMNESLKWPWELKKNKGFFRGSRTNSNRDSLVLLSRRKPHLVRAEYTKNQGYKSSKDTLGMKPVNEVPLEYSCRYKYLFNFAGVAASFRFRHLFLCGSLVFHVGNDWQEFFYAGLKPWVHYVPVKDDLSDVEQLLHFFQEHDHVAKEIAVRGHDFVRDHLTMDEVQCYWRTLLHRYTTLLKFEVVAKPGMKLVG